MKINRISLSLFLILCLLVNVTSAQSDKVSVNINYSFMSGLPDYIDFLSTAVDDEMSMIVAGNILTETQGTDIYIAKYDRYGDLVWERTWNDAVNDADDFAVSVIIGDDLEIYVAGVTENNTQDATDMVILKYDASGDFLWQRKYNGPGNGNDAPADLVFDGNASIYVTGATEGTTTLSDLSVLRLSASTGNLLWAVSFDNSGYYDAGAAISYFNDVAYVTGGSGTAWNNWDIITIRYDSLGQQQGSDASSGSALGFSQPSAIAKDSQGNIVVAGTVVNTGNGKDMKVIKLNEDLNLIWQETIDYFNDDDEVSDMKLDSEDNIYLTGHGTDGNGRVFGVLKKLDGDGAELWETFQKSQYSSGYVKGVKLALSSNGQVAMACNVSSQFNQGVQTFGYSTSGSRYWMVAYENDEGDESVHSLSADHQNNFYINGTTFDALSNKKYFSQKVATLKTPMAVVNDTSGNPLYLNHQVIAAFRPSLVDANFVGDRSQTFIALDDLIPSSLLNTISNMFGQDVSKKIYAEKIFKKLTPVDTISISRNGYEVRIPAFYSRMLLHLPEGYNTENFAAVCSAIFPDIQYAQLNYLGKLGDAPEDTYIDEQASLIPTLLYPNGSINLAPLWEDEENLIVGDPMTKVGVYDQVIDWSHPDFGDGTYEGSKIAGGYDYNSNGGPLQGATPGPHGTAVAGIIGALSNNDIGITGIAGGDGGENTGASLYSFGTGILGNSDVVPLADMSTAIADGARDTPYGLHIANHSWGISSSGSQALNLPLLREAILFMFNNEVAIVAIRGNSGYFDEDIPGSVIYPSGFPDEWIMSVGGSGKNGAYKDEDNGDATWEPSFENVDFIAPSTSCLIVTTSSPLSIDNLPIYLPSMECSWYENIYSNFAGTSAAAPHVSGVCALMHAHHNIVNGYPNNLAPEDFENVLKLSAVEIGPSNGYLEFAEGPDPYNGHGRIDASKAIEIITMPDYRVQHLDVLSAVHTTNYDGLEEATLIYDMNGLDAGVYTMEYYNISYSFNVTLGSTDMIDAVWKRESSSKSLADISSNNFEIEPWNQFDLTYQVNGNNIQGQVTSSCYKVFPNYPDQTEFVWLPADPANLRANLSLHIRYDETVSTKNADSKEFQLYPNPSRGELYIKSSTAGIADIRVFNISGVMIASHVGLDLSQTQILDFGGFPQGIYFIEITTGLGENYNSKFIKL